MAVKQKKTEVAAQKAEVKAVPEAPKQKKDDASFYMYLGPNILGVIQTGSIWRGDIDAVLDQLSLALKRVPQIRNLLIPDTTLAEDRVNVKTPGTRLYNEYRKLVLALKK